MREAFLIDAVRTARGRQSKPAKGFVGELANIHPVSLGAALVNALIERNPKIPVDRIEDLIYSTATNTAEQATDIARNVILSSNLPVTTSGVMLNRYCSGALQANAFASASIRCGDYDIAMAGGGEHMNKCPINSDIDFKKMPFPPEMAKKYPLNTQGAAAEIIADKYNLSQDDLDTFAASSQVKAAAATKAGKFKNEIIPIKYKDATGAEKFLTEDTHIRGDTTKESFAKLQRPFKPNGKIHAGNSSGITDGASMAIWVSDEVAKELGVTARARVVSNANYGVKPNEMLDGPIPGIKLALKRAKLKIEDIDLFEINEAFACVPVACIKELNIPVEKVNVNGGGIAMGHPLGSTGGILLATIVNELERRKGRYGLITLCAALGMSGTMIVERLG